MAQIVKEITYDNTQRKLQINPDYLPIFNHVANKSIQELIKNNPKLLVFPYSMNSYKDDIDEHSIFDLDSENNLSTNNLVGFIGMFGENQSLNVNLQIHSRFDEFKKQYLLQYMLRKVFCPTMLDLQTDTNPEDTSPAMFLAMLFPYYLLKAMRQGLFKQYKHFNHNDSNVKGSIDVKRHINVNIPFAGNVAYATREFSYNNPVTQLMRHTINYLQQKKWIFDTSSEFNQTVQQITFNTLDFDKKEKYNVIRKNSLRIVHPFFTDYEPLRKICLRILSQKGLNFESENSNEKIYGVVFDASWLWEEYLNTLLKPLGFIHPENKKELGRIYLFNDNKAFYCYPDFYNCEQEIVIDAKYKRLNGKVGSDDLQQIISYMHILKFNNGIFIYPFQNGNIFNELTGNLRGFGGDVKTFGLNIPFNTGNFNLFVQEMKNNERKLIDSLKGTEIQVATMN